MVQEGSHGDDDPDRAPEDPEQEEEKETGGEEEDGLGQEMAAGEPDEESEEPEEGQTSRGLTAPARVSQAEREEHERTHTPYRAWCPYCVKGRGYKAAHKKRTEAEKKEEREKRGVPRICMDYFYMSAEDEAE